MIVLWGIVLPLSLYLLMYKRFKEGKNLKENFVFLMYGLKDDHWYYDFIIMIRKALIIIINVFLGAATASG